MIFDKIGHYDGKIALIGEDEKTLTYAELVKAADQFAEKIEARKVIFIMCRNCVEAIVGYVGALRKRIIPVLVNSDVNHTLLNNLLQCYQPAFIWQPVDKALEGEQACTAYVYGSYVLTKTDFVKDYSVYDELALLLTTSGSTGSPKLVRQSYANIVSNTQAIIEYLQIVDTDRAITTLPMNYTYGLSILNTHLCKGAAVILTEYTLIDREFWRIIREQRATTFGGVPYVYEILKRLRFANMDLPDLRYITEAGGKLAPELAEEFIDICTGKNMEMVIMYGQTEATARMSYLPFKYAKDKAGSIGIAIPGGRFELIDEEDHIIEEPEIPGELIYYGDNVTLGYAENAADLGKGDENHGILRTGDMAKRDADGFYYIVGRKKRFLKLFGNRVNLDEVENLLKKQGVENVCTGEDDHLRIYITDQSKESEVKNFIINHTGISKGGFSVHMIEEIPRNDSGKVLYSALR